MYGEKVEEAEELRLDLEDIKEMYKTQVGPTRRQTKPRSPDSMCDQIWNETANIGSFSLC